MHKLSSWLMLSFIIAGAVFAAPVHAEQSKRLGPWEVHYNAFNSTLLRPEMARQYQLERSNTTATLNIVVLAAEKPGKPAQQVSIKGYVMNPLSMQTPLDFREVVEGDAVYYLAQTSFTNLETLRFFITISKGDEIQELRFSEELWRN
ncbi:DUF4426 domain-containing protein [Pseudidiomarina halophila]|uniref:DUF4426 domain-containing protein n=1 Tax=Pseudidiomarina halophila TaxID=1449799 RepID=A0A432Y1U9_9GAMM|nr:DUF4426 domain-containing protein [Pseudidiomarina halophila]RUO54917.1 DUF4426 domain-containing protein [Pseudidiomarina halophila]